MYFGWKVRGNVSREYRGDTDGSAITFGNKAAICSAIDFEIVKFEGEKLNDALDWVGTDSEQLTAQHRSAAFAAGDLSLLFALSQHFIILPFGEWSGVPDTTPPASAKSKISNVSRFAIT